MKILIIHDVDKNCTGIMKKRVISWDASSSSSENESSASGHIVSTYSKQTLSENSDRSWNKERSLSTEKRESPLVTVEMVHSKHDKPPEKQRKGIQSKVNKMLNKNLKLKDSEDFGNTSMNDDQN